MPADAETTVQHDRDKRTPGGGRFLSADGRGGNAAYVSEQGVVRIAQADQV